MSIYSQSEIDQMKDEGSLLRWKRDRLNDRVTVVQSQLGSLYKQIYKGMPEELKEKLDNEIRDLMMSKEEIKESLAEVVDRIQELDTILSTQSLPRE